MSGLLAVCESPGEGRVVSPPERTQPSLCRCKDHLADTHCLANRQRHTHLHPNEGFCYSLFSLDLTVLKERVGGGDEMDLDI